MEIIDYQKLLEDFSKVQIPKEEKTFMDICQYPGSRFEEICSRILAFYFNPNEEHGLRDLWFRALNQCINQDGEYCKPKDIRLILEEYTYCAESDKGRKIDIIIEADNTIYAIENKIGAQLYNPLDVYSEHIEKKYDKKYTYKKKIVLTAHSLSSFDKQKASNFGFEEISYKTLFEQVKTILGDYIADSNMKQLTFMIDFMKTLNNKMNFMENKERAEFFSKNKESVEKMIDQYQKWREEVLKQQTGAIADLLNEIRIKTNGKWGLWDNWDLLVIFNEGTDKKIGIESSFKEVDSNPLALFKIYITTWNVPKVASALQCWEPYEDDVMKEYNGKYLDKAQENDNKRVYLHVAEIEGNKTDEIISTLSDCYTFLKDLADKVAKEQ